MNATLQVILPERSEDDISEDLRELTQIICEANPELDGGFGLGGEFGYGANFENKVFAMRKFYWGDCDCGWEEQEAAWSEAHAHLPDCYWNVARDRIAKSEFTAERERALSERDRHELWSTKSDVAQKLVDEVCNKLRAFELSVYKELCEQHGIPWDDGRGCAVHCTCDHDKEWKLFLQDHPGHKNTCALQPPNFLHKRTGLEIRWYKWIGRDNEFSGTVGNWPEIIVECKASITHPLSPQSE